jgi:pyruvate,water dikinase
VDPLSAPLPWPQYDDAETLWSNDYAREFWSGGISPLHYSIRGGEFAANHREWRVIQGLPAAAALPFVKYRRGTVYMNDRLDEIHRQRLLEAPLPERLWRLARMQRAGCGPLGWISAAEAFGALDGASLDGLPAEQLAELTDPELVAELVDAIKLAEGYNLVLWFGFFVYAPWSMSLLGALLGRAAPDGAGEALADILGGPPETSAIAAEREALWELGREIRRSPELLELVCSDCGGREFFDAAAELPGGRAFLANHQGFLATYGAGGQADRDFFNPRRAEDPEIDRRSLRLAAEAPAERDPRAIAERLRDRRRQRLTAIRRHLLARPWTAPLLPLLQATVAYVDRFWKIRDDQRWAFDRIVMRKKRACLEAARRLVDAGRLDAVEDVYFVTKEELVGSLLRGEPSPGRARLDERRAGFEAMQAGTEEPPHRLFGSSPLRDSGAGAAAEPSGAVSLSPGKVEGKARVIRSLTELMDLRPGEILVCRAVDPGWAAAFFVADGLVLENGGPQSFGATLARGAGIPAVMMGGATNSVRSGEAISLDGSAGTVRSAP